MTKKGPLSKAEKFYIESHIHVELNDLCKDLDRAQSIIKKHLKTVAKDEPVKAESVLYQQFARNNKGSTVMTENAASLADEKRPPRPATPRSGSCTTRIR